MSRLVIAALALSLVLFLAACSNNSESSPPEADGDVITDGDLTDSDSEPETADDESSESETVDGDSVDADAYEIDVTEDESADGDSTDTDQDNTEQDGEDGTASNVFQPFNGFSAASGSVTNSAHRLTFTLAPAALALPAVSGNDSVELHFTVTPVDK